MANTAARLITLILLLQRRPNQKAGELAAELGVSVRTLHRYFEMLEEMGIPIYSERGPAGGFSLVRGYRMPPLVFTPEEAVAVSLGTGLVEELWGQLYREAARGALAKLENVLPDEQRREVAWARRSLVATGMHRADQAGLADALERLRRATRERRRVTMRYHSQNKAEAEGRQFDPYALVHRWGWWYTVGYCHLRVGLRTFRVDRIEGLELLDEPFEIIPGFEIHRYLAEELTAYPQIKARLCFPASAARMVREQQGFLESIVQRSDGAFEATLQSPTLEWAASTVLAFGPLVEVLEPPELRQMISDWAAAVVNKYARKE